MLTKDELPECPVATTVQLIGNKWKLLIIRNLLREPQRFTQLRKTIPGISQKVLTDNLRALEEDGLIEREVFAEVPPRVVYSLSELGNTLRPIIVAMQEWGSDYKKNFGWWNNFSARNTAVYGALRFIVLQDHKSVAKQRKIC